MHPDSSLSGNDAHVLNALFDPESSLSSGPSIDASQNSLPHVDESELSILQTTEARIVNSLTPSNSSRTNVAAAIEQLGKLIDEHPQYAPAYINRAQANRLQLGDGVYTAKISPAVASILADLSTAISLITPSSPAESVSQLQAKLLASAHTHRAYILYKISKSGDLSSLPEPMQHGGAGAVEEMASRDFFLGGRYGNTVAQQMSVRTNPYAKMCGAIVKEALRKEMDSTA
ncbi:hypothetical protein NA57DRAFT_49485 [Rhizodiscina lignyota]|uniref:Uncharacterized protein n=1 Tax=Rhizodiscina lignyota TaxID=1504668 RepID=A0A9P4M0S9_9PEZI|nr:hypothetical protein NA57DRAFT_49485 [Rhizodiscina lignyota]